MPSHLRRLAVIIVLSLVSVDALELRPWRPCTRAQSPTTTTPTFAECTTAVMPLCYDAVCTDASRSSLSLALTRLPATTAENASTPRILWVLPDRSDAVLPSDGANDYTH